MRRDRPIVCLITDRRRLAGAGDPTTAGCEAVIELARSAAAAGVTLVQIREHDLEARRLAVLAASAAAALRGTPTRIVVNDRLDVALTSGVDGVHLRGDSIPPRDARAIAPPGFLVGRSVHSVAEAEEHAPDVDYLIAGPVFPTASKPAGTRWLGTEGLRRIAAAVDVPVLAVGGIDLESAPRIAEAGAAGIAAIGLFLAHKASLAAMMDLLRRRWNEC